MKNKKVYAQQVPPEYQEPHIDITEYPEIEIFENRSFAGHKSELYQKIPDILEDLADEMRKSNAPFARGLEWDHILTKYAPPEGRADYTELERAQWWEIVTEWAYTDNETAPIINALSLIRGKKYELATIRGSVQNEWQNILYPLEYGEKWLRAFETEYFNTGSEWCIKENEDDQGYYMYCITDDPRAEIADITGAAPENIILYYFDGWTKTPIYKEEATT